MKLVVADTIPDEIILDFHHDNNKIEHKCSIIYTMYCPYDFYNGVGRSKRNGHEMITFTSI